MKSSKTPLKRILQGERSEMKIKLIVLLLTFSFVAALCHSADIHMGKWKLNESKSKIDPAMQKKTMIIYEAEGVNVKITMDGVDAAGKATHNEWIGKFDGKDYPVTGDPTSDMRSYTKVDDHTLHAIAKKEGKTTTDVHIVVAADGKSRTVTSTGTDSKGKKITSVFVYDKQ